ncbi:MAG: hypothetical protein COB53_03930 [Elusimicrobia bacterium]|nr:MAG: hypothetical protein COB53_03930 [Elusimicrobiota bacterium]
MIVRLLPVAILLLASVPAFSADARLAVFRRTHYTLELPLVDPFEKLLHDGAAELVAVENIPVDSNGAEFLFKLPSRFQETEAVRAGTRSIEVYDSAGGIVVFLPASPEFEGLFESLAREPDSFLSGKAPPFRRVKASLTREPLGGDEWLHTLRVLDPTRVRHPQWRASLAFVYRFQFAEKVHTAFFLFRTQGGEGRTASAIQRLRDDGKGDPLVLNRGEIFAFGATVTSGTTAGRRFEKMGVDVSVPGAGELARFEDLRHYREERGEAGIQFISANLVYSSNTSISVLPKYRIFKRNGATIAVFGLTDKAWSKYLPPSFAKRYKLIDPLAAARLLVPYLRKKADFVVALSNIPPDQNARLQRKVPGIDVITGNGYPFETTTSLPERTIRDAERGPFDTALAVTGDLPTVLTDIRLKKEGSALTLHESHVLLDDSLPDLEGFVKFKPSGFGVLADGKKPILPASRVLYPEEERVRPPRLQARDFWNLTASLLTERVGAEVAILPIFEIYERTTGAFSEELVREWFRFRDRLVVFELPGSALKSLVAEVRRQEKGGEVPTGGIEIAAGGLGEGDTIHGTSIDRSAVYRVLTTDRVLAQAAQFPWLKERKRVQDVEDLTTAALEELRNRAEVEWTPERYRPLLAGRSIQESGLWSVRFRDVSINLSNTKVVADSAFSNVSNARVRGFDELLIGGVSKVDVEYRSRLLKWTNAFEMEYSRSRIRPPGKEEILNTPKNRSSVLTVGTWNLASFPWHSIGRSLGPSLGFQYEGHVERLPLQRRKHVFSIYPGVEFFNGSFVRSLQISGNVRRDWTPLTPVNKYGFRARALLSRSFGKARLQGKFVANYFIRTRDDTDQDLRLELSSLLKLHLPIWKNLTLAPFIDVDYFILKVRPIAGYSAITGLSLSFSRLWKPQFEKF